MPKAVKIYPFVELSKLKKWGALDAQSDALIKQYMAQNKNILILGNGNSGINTFQHSLAHYAFKMHHNPVIIPPVRGVNVDRYFKTSGWKNYRKVINDNKQTVMAGNYKGTFEDLYPHLKNMWKQFDVVIDLRKLGNKRTICQIYELKGNKWQMPYFNEHFFDKYNCKFSA